MNERLDLEFLDPAHVDPEELSLLLEQSGWVRRGGRDDLYYRWAEPTEVDDRSLLSVIVPLDTRAADYPDLMHEAIYRLRSAVDTHRESVLPILRRLVAVPGDELKFRKAVTTVRGAVPWPTGEDLYASARGVLIAGAKSRVSRQAYYGQKNGRFARRFLEAVLMGQTQVGSYVVTAFAPPQQEFPEKAPKEGSPELPNVASYSGREVVESIVTGLQATQEAISHYEATNSLSGFEDQVRAGVSREMTDALLSMVRNAEAAAVTVEWSPDARSLDEPSRPTETLEFSGGVEGVLEKASAKLSTVTPAVFVTASGWVSVVARPKRGKPGIVRLKVRGGSEASTLQVRLTEEQFEVAATAIAHEQGLVVSGRQEKEGNRHWLYDAAELRTIDLPIRQSRRKIVDADEHDELPEG